MQAIISELSNDIIVKYETKRKIINNITYSGIPLIKLYYKNIYFARYGVSETKRLYIGKNHPEKSQIAALEIFEIEDIQKLKSQIINELKGVLSIIDLKENP
jgi:hypothetical protein